MNLSDYQTEVRRTMSDTDDSLALANYAMGLAGEAGEVIEPLKKYLFHCRPLDRDAITKEAGDVLWYVTAICNVLGIDMQDVLAANVAKLRERYPSGFKPSEART